MYSKGDNFCDLLFAYLKDEVFQNEVSSKRNELAPLGANSFLYEITLIIMEGNYENDGIACPENVHIRLI